MKAPFELGAIALRSIHTSHRPSLGCGYELLHTDVAKPAALGGSSDPRIEIEQAEVSHLGHVAEGRVVGRFCIDNRLLVKANRDSSILQPHRHLVPQIRLEGIPCGRHDSVNRPAILVGHLLRWIILKLNLVLVRAVDLSLTGVVDQQS